MCLVACFDVEGGDREEGEEGECSEKDEKWVGK